jgi:hypothetical protein
MITNEDQQIDVWIKATLYISNLEKAKQLTLEYDMYGQPTSFLISNKEWNPAIYFHNIRNRKSPIIFSDTEMKEELGLVLSYKETILSEPY